MDVAMVCVGTGSWRISLPVQLEYLHEQTWVLVGIHILACDHKTILKNLH